jgi:ectoine hydroxylase-related dioxygenase (phytanoyl-CoA dioxygenase family)
MILYYSDVTAELGPTYVVSQEKTRDLPLWPTHRPRKKNEKLCDHERPVLAKAGDLLIFSMRTWHRASDMTADFGARFSHHFVWRSAKHNFQGYHLWSRMGENSDLQRFVEHTKPRQREVLGFPTASDNFWTDETIAAVQLRYPKMDFRPYARHARQAD